MTDTGTDHTQSRPINILIINLHSSFNAGDAALALTTIEQLSDSFPGSQITLSMNDPSSHPGEESTVGSFMYWYQTISEDGAIKRDLAALVQLGLSSLATILFYRLFKRANFFQISPRQKMFLQAYLDSDLVVSAPGNFLYSSGKFGIALLTAVYSMALAIFARKPLYLFPQSIGPFRHAWERALVKYVISRARIIMVREPVSMQQLNTYGVKHPRCYQIPDLAFSFSGASYSQVWQWLASHGVNIDQDRPLMGITAINWVAQTSSFTKQTQYETAIIETARHFIRSMRGKVILFTQVYGSTPAADDRIPTRRIAERLQEVGNRVVLIEQPTPSEVLKTAYGLMDVFIGTRMHSNIFAITGGVPVMAIAYRHKTRGIMQLLGLGDWVMEIDQVSGEKMVKMLDRLWCEKQLIRDQIKTQLSGLINQSRQAGLLVASDYSKLPASH